jgi:alkylation response protein AidB-like acyl-CoA dehydrogenase
MNFLLSDEQEQLLDTVQRLAGEQGGDAARRAYSGDGGFDRGYWDRLMALGIGGLLLPEAYGGSALEMIDAALAAEALGHAAAPAPVLGHWLAGLAIALGGSDDQKARWLPELAAGTAIGALALEGPDAASWTLAADSPTVSGPIANVPGGGEADLYVIGLGGGRLAIVEHSPAVETIMLDGVDRTRPIADLILVAAAIDPLPGDVAARVVDAACVLLAADAFGGASRCLAMAVDYAGTREQFGRPIGAFQGVKFQIAEMAVDVEPARGLYWYAAHAFDHLPEDAPCAAAAAKAHCTDVFMRTARANVEAHGGIGYTWEHDAQIYFKRAMFDFAWLGTPAEHRARQAALNGW